MRWKTGRRSEHIEDRRGMRIGRAGIVGGGIGMVVLALLAMFLGVDPGVILGPGSPVATQDNRPPTAEEQELADFTSVVLAETEDVWGGIFQRNGGTYRKPTLVLFTDAVQSACGTASSAVGPFYCPLDSQVYLDLGFFEQLSRQLGAPGDFAQAYVVAHEVGHHVQNLLGLSGQVREAQQRMDESQANRLSVMLELQADCFAGLWAHYADRERNIVEEGDIDEALNAASQIGDDTLQRRSRGEVVPDSFTHGSSEQRMRWFMHGFTSGDLNSCDTFGSDDL
ncbi:neutral zinc metallopeptidase [Desulfocurvibacter africanus]|uniref:Flagellar biosynthesis protein FlgM n=1 Tax=Desulfocurvibacter africanus subsp. africanus str. Walvis Bay TaxID=690850 RepID=F3YZZ9_DESAF|nr:neutral zinc metallopeptidase [Desulfocurvibacter africanus]EGJ52028.1 protein of unknown function zinc metallopeptidase [Desulfocurvibacter africanus subsp. africanus str. Walvis Bay]